MVWNSALLQRFSSDDKKLLVAVINIHNAVHDLWRKLPRTRLRKLPRFECHTICRALAKKVPTLLVEDGKYFGLRRAGETQEGQFADHSWLVTPDGAIIDPYPVGFLTPNPVLVVTRGIYQPYGSGLYVPDKRVRRSFPKLRVMWKTRILFGLIQEATAS